MAMDEAGRQRAARYTAERMARRGWGPGQLALHAGVDQSTIRTFVNGESWPWATKRAAIEDALGLGRGTLELVARGMVEVEEESDPVERAILGSRLTRANQHTLIGTYYGMLEDQQQQPERGSA